jgi:UDP-glucose 4-epimerase
LARGHRNALEYFKNHPNETLILNLGTGGGYSVLEVINAFELTSGIKIKYRVSPRRAGDIPVCFANNQQAKTVLNWHPQYDLLEMCRDSWNWQKKNPNGYVS